MGVYPMTLFLGTFVTKKIFGGLNHNNIIKLISDNELMQNMAIQMAFIKELQKEESAQIVA
jgi:hypothetical protein